MTDAPETIVAAAIQWEGLTYSLPRSGGLHRPTNASP